jgi:hypothetical protein
VNAVCVFWAETKWFADLGTINSLLEETMKTLFGAVLLALFIMISCISPLGNNDNKSGDDGDDDGSGNGSTWTDSSSGLTWELNPTANALNWADATTYCNNLTLAGIGWHLPSISELRSLIIGCPATITGGHCGVTDDCTDYTLSCYYEACQGCASGGGPGIDGAYWNSALIGKTTWGYWSSSEVTHVYDSAPAAWLVNYTAAFVSSGTLDSLYSVRCVHSKKN